MLGLLDLLLTPIEDKLAKSKPIVKNVVIDDVYNEKFIVELLEIPETEYYNFIDFVNEDSRTAFVLKLDDELKILEYLMNQRDVFVEKYKIKN